jgi:hypothetical protein
MGVVMKPFPYWRDPLFLIATLSYALNRWLLKPVIPSPFLHGHLSDLLLIPAALPLVLWLQRRTGLRQNDSPPTWREIGWHLVIWSVICEFIGPHWLHHGTADLWDVAAYVAGGVAAGIWWNQYAPRRSVSVHEF